jgi:acetyltransferase-like isoleucine patch superfamily enzyme
VTAAAARVWLTKWRWYERNSLPWNRARIHWELARREAFARWPLHGDVLEALRSGRLEVGAHALFEPHVWITAPGRARVRVGRGTFLNLGVMIAAVELVEIGDHCMLANGCFVTDGNHRFDDPGRPVPWQGFTTKGPTRIADNCWLGANVVVTSGVTIGERCVIGANSVVTHDIPAFSIAAGAPAEVRRRIVYSADERPEEQEGVEGDDHDDDQPEQPAGRRAVGEAPHDVGPAGEEEQRDEGEGNPEREDDL